MRPPRAAEVILDHNSNFMLEDCERSLIHETDLRAMGWYATTEGYAIPYRDPETGAAMTCPDGREFIRTRVRFPKNGAKYLSPTGGGIRCFIHPMAHKALIATPSLPLILTEGEKKAACATIFGMPCVGIGGIWLWKQSGTEGDLNGDLVPYVTGGRDVILIYDSDATETPRKTRDFADCARRLAVALEPFGSRLFRFDMPKCDGGKVGLDDFLVQNGGDTAYLMRLIDGEVAA